MSPILWAKITLKPEALSPRHKKKKTLNGSMSCILSEASA